MLKSLFENINKKVPAAKAQLLEPEAGDHSIKIEPEAVLDVAKFLRDYDAHPFKVLEVISGLDYGEELEVCYILATFCKEHNHEFILKTRVPRSHPKIPSVCSVWKAANFQERECYDMIGVEFQGHPDHRRILCPDDWEGFPLRKDYVAAKKYKHMFIYPEDKMNHPEREYVEKLKQDSSITRPELNW